MEPLMKRCAFTLIELLVVISIISLLIAILLPALGRAKWQTVLTQCASNQHQWGIANTAYATDHKGLLPSHPIGAGGNALDVAKETYDIMIDDYGMAHENFFCPEHSPEYTTIDWMTFGTGLEGTSTYFVGYSFMVPRPWFSDEAPRSNIVNGKEISQGPRSIDDVERAGNAVMADSLIIFPLGTTWADEWGNGHDYSGDPESVNALFVDGSVEARRKDLWEFRFQSGNAQTWY